MTINLIPPQIKKGRQISQMLGQLFFGFVAILILVTITSGAFLLYNSYLIVFLKHSENLVHEETNRLKTFRNVELDTKAINAKLGQIEAKNDEKVYWSTIFDLVSGATPKNVQIKSLNLNNSTMTALLTGNANTRTDIALMKEKLESISTFKNVTFTTSSYNLLTDDYSFSLNFEISK